MNRKSFLKGIAGVSLTMLLMLMTCKMAHADVIFEPRDDFYQKHANACEYEDRSYIANGAKGYVTLFKSPESKKKEYTLENGTTFYVSFIYTDKKDNTWGIVERYDYEKDPTKPLYKGWLRMTEVQLVYDGIAFCKEHESEFKKYNGEFDNYVPESKIILWSFPGSGEITGKIDKLSSDHSFEYTYKDEEGRLWGYYTLTAVSTWNSGGSKYINWICLSDPTNENIPVIQYAQPTIIPPSAEAASSNSFSKSDTTGIIFMGVGVGILIMVTTVLIRIFWKNDAAQRNKGIK